MARASRSVAKRKRHKKWLTRAKGFRGRRRTVFRLAKEAVLKAGQHSYKDRRKNKSRLRQEWHIVINAAVRAHKTSYSRFMNALKKNNIELNRKVLSEIAEDQPQILEKIFETIK